jgi:hypothetical protein
MKNLIGILVIILVFSACVDKTDNYPNIKVDWESKTSKIQSFEDYYHGETYLPVYSHIYHIQEHRKFNLAITVSMRNVSATDSVYILKADYYNTVGENIRQYIKHPIYLKPLETLEIIIEEQDEEGGSGANFVFDWAMGNDINPPLFESVMISTSGQQGLSFTTRGVRVYE